MLGRPPARNGADFPMPFLLLLVLTFSCLNVRWPSPPAWVTRVGQAVLAAFGIPGAGDIAGSLLFTWGAVAAVVIAAWLLSVSIRRSLRTRPDRRQILV